MTRSSTTLILSAIATMMVADHRTNAFAPSIAHTQRARPALVQVLSSPSSVMERQSEVPYFADEPKVVPTAAQSMTSTATPQAPTKTEKSAAAAAKKGGAQHKKGVFSPVVLISKQVLGAEKLNKLRAKVISLHSDTIAGFVDTYETTVGRAVLKNLFELADRDSSGTIDQQELQTALRTLGFDWLQEKQVSKIFERADTDADGGIDFDEWMKEAPKTLRTNLIKLAKKNGGDMGLLV